MATAARIERPATRIERSSEPGADRYRFDTKRCHPRDGWSQVDTSQDAHYYGQWASPFTLELVCYCEGDVSIETANTPEDFATLLRYVKQWNDDQGHTFHGIDGMLRPELIARWKAIGLGDLLH